MRRHDKTHTPDGRRCNKWVLIDQHGGEHLAVVGLERDTRDGHYTYTAVRLVRPQHFVCMCMCMCSHTHTVSFRGWSETHAPVVAT